MGRRGKTAAKHQHAGVDSTVYADFAVGQRVMTSDGFPGVVTEVMDGPIPGTEQYLVTLDAGVGGGEYTSSDLSALGNAREAVQVGEYVVPMAIEGAVEHTAADDYPELGEILVSRPPLAHAEPLHMSASRTAAKDNRFEGVSLKQDDDGWYVATHRARSDSYPTPEDIPQSKVDFIESTGSFHTTGQATAAWERAQAWGATTEDFIHAVAASKTAAGDNGCTACGGTGEQGTGHECYICDGSGDSKAEHEGREAGVNNDNPGNGLPVGRDDSIGQQPKTAAEQPAAYNPGSALGIGVDRAQVEKFVGFPVNVTYMGRGNGSERGILTGIRGEGSTGWMLLLDTGDDLLELDPLLYRAISATGPRRTTAALYYLDTPESNALYEQASNTLGQASRAMATVEVPDDSIADGTAQVLALTARPDLLLVRPGVTAASFPQRPRCKCGHSDMSHTSQRTHTSGSGKCGSCDCEEYRKREPRQPKQGGMYDGIPMDIPALPEDAIRGQFSQYPQSGPEGISYFKGVIDARNYVDCLLYREGGKLLGVLNHYPKDMGPERKGNVLLLVLPEARKQGIGKALWDEAVKRWGVTVAQDATPMGRSFLRRMSSTYDDAKQRFAENVLTEYQRLEAEGVHLDWADVADAFWCEKCGFKGEVPPVTSINGGKIDVCPQCGDVTPFVELDSQGWPVAAAADGKPFFAVAGLWDSVIAPIVDKGTAYLDKDNPDAVNGGSWSYDWCRFRKNRRCMYPKHLNVEATEKEGYTVWIPEDRGLCPRDKWDQQKECPVSEPGPHSGEPDARIEATVAWEDGGQRDGIPDPRNPKQTHSSLVHKQAFEFTASWSDVRTKARRIRTDGGVRIIAVPGSVETGLTITAEINGDTNLYETTIIREPGKRSVASWSCGCAWAAYSWGRSGRWKKYEGRMCAHALALAYEAQSQGMFGGTINEQPNTPPWRTKDPQRSGDYVKNPLGLAASLRPVDLSADLQAAPAAAIALAMLSDGHPAHQVMASFGGDERIISQALAMRFRDLRALVRGTLRKVKYVFSDENAVMTDDGDTVPVTDVLYPTYHPTRGLSLSDRQAALEKDNDPEITMPGTDRGYPYDQPWYDPSRWGVVPSLLAFGDDTFLFETDNSVEMEQGDPAGAASYVAATRKTAFFDVPDQANADQAADFLMNAAAERANFVTSLLQNLASDHGGRMDSLDFRLKKRPRLKEKIEDAVRKKHIRPDQAAEEFQDALRFTMLLPNQEYSEAVEDCLRDLESHGIRPLADTLIKNYWLRGDPYDGVNGVFRLADGFPFELQFHTEASLDLKMQNHVMYEEFRAKGCPPARRKELWDKMVADTYALERPPGESDVGVHNRHYLSAFTAGRGQILTYYAFIDSRNPGSYTGVFRSVSEPDNFHFERWSNSVGGWVEDNSLAQHPIKGDPTVDQVSENEAQVIIAVTSHLPGAALLTLAGRTAASEDTPTHAGLVLKAADTGRVLMLQRCLQDEDDPAAGTWEFPGGGREDGDETSLHAAMREFAEEVGQAVPEGGHVSHVWTSPNGVYVGHVVVIPTEADLVLHEGRSETNPDDPDGDYSEQSAWWDPDDAKKNPALRSECKSSPWDEIKKAASKTARYLTLDDARAAAQGDIDPTMHLAVDGVPLKDWIEGSLDLAHTEALVTEALHDPATAPEMAEVVAETLASDPPGPGDPRLAWLMSDAPAGAGSGGAGGEEIAAAAKAFLAKQALKEFSPAEQREIIDEGLDVQAANLGDLDIAGTHYESLEAAFAAQDDDEGWLM